MIFTTLEESEFTKFEQHNKYGNFFQSIPRAKVRKKMGFNTFLVGVKDDKKILAAALIIERENEALLQLGPILDYDDLKLLDFFLTEIKKFAREHGFIKLEIFPPLLLATHEQDGSIIKSYDRTKIFDIFKKHGYRHEGFTTKVENKANRWMFVKDLSGIKDIREAELTMNSSTRKKLHKTRRELDIKVLKDKSELKEWLESLKESDLRNGVKTRDVKYYEDLWDAFGDDAVFVEARRKDNGELVSSEVDIFHPNEMVAFTAGTIEKNKHFNGSTAIKGWNIEECLRRKKTRMNLYGMAGDFSPSNPLLFFKAGLGGVTEEYIGGFELVLNKKKLLLNKIRRRVKRVML
ncbi:peptidoglycan bridge formation glycyltransferase FemA/FemB family protein [Candidatus Saccharibacteria bacterium]|nr:peptidoglycan bridge formation glycyltransferase FemA/FemB family protein [Candidatus Saccharibacteria bacterium]MBR3332483.1 peptidoglycan bridge formation glycyltransferase FemA/FemB family protein [Candidatus Saccharibacteria bacterium]